MKVEYDENPLKSRVILDERDMIMLRNSIMVDELEDKLYDICRLGGPISYTEALDSVYEKVERVVQYYLQALGGEIHCGDCTKVPSSCVKCHAEDAVGVNTLTDIRHPYYVTKAFSDCRKTLEEAISYLRDNPAKHTWVGSEPYVESWQKEQDITIEDLMKYQQLHFASKVCVRDLKN